MISLYISESQISIAHFSRVQGSSLIANISVVELEGSLVESINNEELAVNYLINGIEKANKNILFSGNEILICFSDTLVNHEVFQTEIDFSDNEIIQLVDWKRDKRFGSTVDKFQAFIELYNDRRLGHIVYIHDYLIKATQRICDSYSCSPIWMGSKSMILYALGNLPLMTIELSNDYYNIFYFGLDTINGGRVRFGKGGLKCIDSFGDKHSLEKLLSQKFTMKNKPPWTLLLNELSDVRKKHWERFDLKKHELFSELSLDNAKIDGTRLTIEHKIILSTMIMHPNIHQGINMYNNPLLVNDRAFHEDSFIYNNYEHNELSDLEVKNKDYHKKKISKESNIVKRKWKNPFIVLIRILLKPFIIIGNIFNNLISLIKTSIKLRWSTDDVISFISAFLLIGSFALTIYLKEMKQKKIPKLEYEYINAISDIKQNYPKNNNPLFIVKDRLPFGNTLSKDEIIYLQSNAMKEGLKNIFSIIGPSKLIYVSTLENILNFEFIGENIPKGRVLKVGNIFETRRDRIDCCGGYKYYTGIEMKYKDFQESNQSIALPVSAILSILKSEYKISSMVRKDDRIIGNRIQTPIIIGLNSNEETVRKMINDISNIANNLLFRKIVYKFDPETEQTKGTLYLSIIHPILKPKIIGTIDNTELQ
ncbi:MAG: hypothetical protein VX260_02685 [Candidatus Neomarinimicrobiota bacterium]|nr:hypothetical protein [Candidatus Neomarinimicrobiota bacterium]